MLRIRLSRVGKKRQPSYRIVVADVEAPRDGRIVERIGHYNPLVDPADYRIDESRALYWLSVGAQPTDAVERLLVKQGTRERLGRLRAGEPLEELVAEFTGSEAPVAVAAAAVEEKVEVAAETVTDAVEEAVADVETAVADAVDSAAETIDEATDAVAEVADDAQDAASDVTAEVEEEASGLVETAQDLVESAVDNVEEVVAGAASAASDIIDSVVDAVTDDEEE